ncbi:ABC transporter ATP-binding protein [Flavihumibacter cheonanensis]|uniref:ABC transporter ATP-binding protein n=1 Tax=Flavihumibacter cheonanensis TaxID=1442385 RepID=UPI001EF917CE|nr:ABC transporter ATP-binding protein [Flavihumibacter cheonanensis]MCG7753336.1 ABC transporter ATP-binding protein [Flavihumibacter cheonanensis]
MPVLEMVGLCKHYNGVPALTDLNLSIQEGEVFCLLGQNGAGKTTTIHLILGFLEASSGSCSINGIPVQVNSTDSRKEVAYIPEIVQLYGQLSGLENLDFFSRLAGSKYANQELSAFLSKAGLQKEAHTKRLATYSKGMRQKVGIAIALAKNAKLIVMDEPTSGLDPKATAEFTQLCKQLSAEGTTLFMATHDIFNAVSLGTRIGIMKEGRLVHELSTSAITAEALQQVYLETI